MMLLESLERHCAFYKAQNGKWYMELADKEYGDWKDSTTYGPFDSEDEAMDQLNNFANPGSFFTDEDGTKPVPKKSPNGQPVQSGRSFGYDRYRPSTPFFQTAPSKPRPAALPPPKAPEAPASVSSGKKELYKIYGPQHSPKSGSTQLSTRVKGRVYVPSGPSRFKKGQQARMAVDGDRLSVSDPESNHTQKWKAFEALVREFVSLID